MFAPEGRPFILLFIVLSVPPVIFGFPLLALLPLALALFMLYFFRDPERNTLAGRGVFYAPADGKVVLIRETEESELLNARALEISIFMSPLDVHVNRAPCDGTVKDVRHYQGKFSAAFRKEAASMNEHVTMLLETEVGPIVLRQVAGFLARRVVCRVSAGDTLKQGDRYGIIKFSSRVDLFAPLDTVVKVKLHDRVRAGESVLGIIRR